jgi:hypothetical protein
MSTPDIENYLAVARSETLQRKFPSLKKFNRKRTKLKPWEKAQITRAANIYEKRQKPRYEREEKYLNYVYPGDRVKSDERYKKEATQLASLDKTGEFKRLSKRRRKLTAAEKTKITKARKATPGFEQTFPLTKEQAKRLPKDVVRGRGNVRGIKLSKMSPEARITRVTKDALYVDNLGKRFKYIPLGDPENAEKYAERAEREFAKGAKSVYFFTTHGIAGTGAGDLSSFLYLLNNRFAEYLQQTLSSGFDTDWLQGIAARY